MANENKEIGEIVKKCKILLLDIEGTTTSISFVKDKLFPYAEENVKSYLDSQWETERVKGAVAALRKQALEDTDATVEGVVAIPGEDASKDEQIEGLVSNFKWQMSCDRKAGALKQLQGLIWKMGYDNGDIKGHVYEDVPPALEQWHSVEGQKVYIYSSGSIQAQKLLFGQTQAGDLLSHIDGHFDTSVGGKLEAASYTNIVEMIGAKAEEILFLTDIVKEAESARASGLHAALVSREGNAPLPADAAAAFPLLHSLAELAPTNKRKQETQDEQPTKVLKTDAEDDVKTTVAEAESSEATVTSKTDEPEKMEVEEDAVTTSESITVESKEDIVVDEITDSNEAAGIPVIDTAPVVEEKEDKEIKAEEKETEKMETENEEAVVENGELSEPVTSETPSTTVTEIEDVSDKQLGDVAEIIEHLDPVVEEPAVVVDMEELQNVGEVLEKECDEILSKVQDVTNLDNIPIKPLLNSIAEETMETENTDSNDIVDRILDTELELEMKQCAEIDLKTVKEITDEPKAEVVEENLVKDESSPIESNVPEVKAPENNVDEKFVPEEQLEESISMETNEAKIEEVQNSETESKEPIEISLATEKATKSTDKEEGTSKAEEVKPSSEEVKPTVVEVKTGVDQTDDVTPVVEEATPVVEEEMPVVEEATPVAGDATPVAEEATPVIEEAMPVAEEVTPLVEVATPVVEEAMPVVEEATPVVKEATPIAEEVTPVVEEETPVVEEAKPDTEEAKPTEEVKPTTEESKPLNEVKEPQMNGKATNDEAVAVNGDSSKDEELSSRLSVANGKEIENGKEVVNGSNDDSMDSEKVQGDKIDTEPTDIKVKTVNTGEPRTDPIEQPSEA